MEDNEINPENIWNDRKRKMVKDMIKREVLILNESYGEHTLNTELRYDINFNGKQSDNGWKLSIIGKSLEDSIDVFKRLHSWLTLKNISHKSATKKRVEHDHYEQSKKVMTIYVPNDMDYRELAHKIEILLRGYKGWEDIKLPFKSYEHYSNAIFFRNDRNENGEYIPAN
jgi:hypothetical protein